MFQNKYQEVNHCYVQDCTYSFDIHGNFIVKVNEIIVDLSQEGLSTQQKVMLWPQVAQEELKQRLKQKNASNWILITAFNPRGKDLSSEENKSRHDLLLQEVKRLGFISDLCHAGDFTNPNGHLEMGLVCYDVSDSQALDLARMFQQNAWIGGDLRGQVCLYWVPEARADLER